MHYDFFLPNSREVPALLALVRAEAPDLAVSLHSARGRPALVSAACVSEEVVAHIQNVAIAYDQQVLKRFGVARPTFRLGFEQGTKAFNLTIESPTGIQQPGSPSLSLDDLLDLQLLLYETMMDHLLAQRRDMAAVSNY